MVTANAKSIFFREHAGYPKFKSKQDNHKSYTINYTKNQKNQKNQKKLKKVVDKVN